MQAPNLCQNDFYEHQQAQRDHLFLESRWSRHEDQVLEQNWPSFLVTSFSTNICLEECHTKFCILFGSFSETQNQDMTLFFSLDNMGP